MARRQLETTPRQVMEDDYKGQFMHVVTAFEIRTFSWPFHVFVGPNPDRMQKVGGVGEASSIAEAFDRGFDVARAYIDGAGAA